MSDGILHKIEVIIAGRKYPIKVTKEEETIVRNIEKHLNQKIHEFQIKYGDRDKMDCVLMTLLTVAFDNAKSESSIDNDEIDNRLNKLEQLIDSALN